MAAVTGLIQAFNNVLDLTEDIKVAEKSKVQALKNDAKTIFQKSFEEYIKLQSITNTLHVDNRAHAELVVLLSEAAFATECYDTSRDILENFLFAKPQKDQFYCRAKLLMAKIIDHEASGSHGMENIDRRKAALVHVMECLNVVLAPDNLSRYKFLVFNASVICWHITHQFLRPNRAKFFLPEMQRMVGALESVDDPDTDWRIMYSSATAYCFNDDKQAKPALDMMDKAIEQLEKLVQKSQAHEDAVQDELRRVTKEAEDLAVSIRRVEAGEDKGGKGVKDTKARRSSMSEQAHKDHDEAEQAKLRDMRFRLDQLQAAKVHLGAQVREAGEEKLPLIERLARLNMQKISFSVAEAKKVSASVVMAKNIRPSVLLQLQQFVSMSPQDREKEKEPTAVLLSMITQLEGSKETVGVAETLLDVARVAWTFKYRDIALRCMDLSSKNKAVSPAIRVKQDTCQAMQIVAEIESDSIEEEKKAHTRLSLRESEGYKMSRRIEAIKLLERVLNMCTTRLDDAVFTEEACTLLWNIALPLMQPHLRQQLHSVLRVAVTALHSISSRQVLLRTQLHYELAKCEENGDFVVQAKAELEKALFVDYGMIEAEVSHGSDTRPSSGSTSKPKKGAKGEAAVPAASAPFDPMKRSDEINPLRKLDHHIQPMLVSLTQRADVYGLPTTAEDSVAALLQQIRESSSRAFQQDALVRAATLLVDAVEGRTADVSVSGGSKKRKSLSTNISHSEVESFISRSSTVSAGQSHEPFRKLTQRRVVIAYQLIKIALIHKNVFVVEWMTRYILSFHWNEGDPFVREFLSTQVEACHALAEVLVLQLSQLWLEPDAEKTYNEVTDKDEPDPRMLGVESRFSTPEMLYLKRLVILTFQTALHIANQISDEVLVQNTFIYFWNLHLHVFRKSYYRVCIPEVFEFVKAACASVEALSATHKSAIDERLSAAMYEVLACFHEKDGQIQVALDTAMKGITKGSVYTRKRICTLANRLNLLLLGAGKAAGGKGVSKNVEPVKCDHPILLALGMLFIAESSETPIEQQKILATKLYTLMETEVKAAIASVDIDSLSSDEFNQMAELQAECWTRLTRLRIGLSDIHGAQQTAEQCLHLVTSSLMSDNDKQRLNSRVLRWISVCERYFGIAISQLLKAEGQEKVLQNELRLAALRHFTLAAQFGLKAKLDDLIIAAARRAWSVTAPMSSDPTVRDSLFGLQKQLVEVLASSAMEGGGVLLQQFYMAMVEGQIDSARWDDAMRTIFEAFERVPTAFQKPLWKCRVIILSKKGKNVLDGIQKLKESDVALQARVYAIVARASSRPKQQLDAYYKAIALLSDDLYRIEYMLETAQWICSNGLPKIEAYELLQGCIDAVYEVEDQPDLVEDEDFDDGSSRTGSRVGGGSHSSSPPKQSQSPSHAAPAKTTTSNRPNAGSVGSAGSLTKKKIIKTKGSENDDDNPLGLNMKHLTMATQAVVMLAMLETQSASRAERCLEAVTWVKKSLTLWAAAVKDSYKLTQYAAQPIAVREQTSIESFVAEFPKALDFPTDPIDLIRWCPPVVFIDAMNTCQESCPYRVPTEFSISYLALTCFYLRWLATALFESGHLKHTLLILSWSRLLLMFINCPGKEYALGLLHYRTLNIFINCGLSDFVKKLPTRLGLTDMDCSTLISKLCAPQPADESVHHDEDTDTERATFSIISWTQVLRGVDRIDCSIEICAELISLGMLPVARLTLACLKKECTDRNDARGSVRVTALLTQVFAELGRPEVVISQILGTHMSMTYAGDVSLLSKHIVLLSAAYMKLNQPTQAHDTLLQSISLIENVFTIAIPTVRKTVSDQRSQLRLQDQSKLRGESSLSSMNTIASSVMQLALTESSFEAAAALAKLATALVQIMLSDARQALDREDDLRPFVDRIDAFFCKKVALVESVLGNASIDVAIMLFEKATAVFQFLKEMHTTSSLIVPITVYVAWLDGAVLQCVRDLEFATDILRGLHVGVPFSQRSYSFTVVEEVVPGEVSESLPQPQTIPLLCAYDVLLATALHELAVEYAFLTQLRREDITITDGSRDEAQSSVIEYYLEGSRARNAMVLTDFITPAAFKCIFSATSASRLIQSHTTDSRDVDSLAVEYKASLMTLARKGDLDTVWVKLSSVPLMAAPKSPTKQKKDATTAPTTGPLPEELLRIQYELARVFNRALRAGRWDAASESALCLVDAHGHTGVRSSAYYLLHYQSIRVRSWLMQVWKQSLSASSTMAQTLGRLQAFESELLPSAISQQRAAIDMASLQSHVIWKRLSVTRLPEELLSQSGQVCFFSLQCCPVYTNVYVAVGGENVPGNAIDDKWAIDKMNMFESSRRTIQQLKRQHATWKADVTRFIAQYGDAFTPDMDEANEIGNFQGTSFTDRHESFQEINDARLAMKRVEHSLAERLRAILADMERVFLALIGPDSRACKWLASTGSLAPDSTPLVLLIDPQLQELPWEGLDIFNGSFRGRCCRDFSLHLFAHRLALTVAHPAPGGGGAAAAPGGAAAAAPMASIATARPVHASAVQCVVDPLSEDKGSKAAKYTREPLRNSLEALRTSLPGGTKWSLLESNGAMTLQDWVSMSQKFAVKNDSFPAATTKPVKGKEEAPPQLVSTLLFNAPGRIGSSLIPRELSLLNLESTGLVFIADSGHNDASYRHQSATDIQKRASDIAGESPVQYAALLSLTGVTCVVSHMWSTSFCSQQRFIKSFWETFTMGTKTITGALDSCSATNRTTSRRTSSRPPTPGDSFTGGRQGSSSPLRGSAAPHAAKAEQPVSAKVASSKGKPSLTPTPVPVPAAEAKEGGRPLSAKAEGLEGVRLNEGNEQSRPVKRWIALSRVVFGVPTLKYADV